MNGQDTAGAGHTAQREGTPTPMVEVVSLGKRYGRTLALDDISFDINRNEMFALLGPNGAGKTTLIHILCTILRPDSGTARICGHDVVRQPLEARRDLGVVFQEPSLDSRLSVEENLEFHGRVYGVPRQLRRQRITELLELVGLTDVRQNLVRTLSPGMKRRLEIARALVHDAKVIILDEPTIGLDAQSRERIWEYLGLLRSERGLTLIVTTHYIDEVERCDRVCIMDHGKILALDTPSAIRSRHGREAVRLQPVDAEVAHAIIEAFPQARTETSGEIVIVGEVQSTVDRITSQFGSGIRHLTFERSSLESAFLELTGRVPRDATHDTRGKLITDEPVL